MYWRTLRLVVAIADRACALAVRRAFHSKTVQTTSMSKAMHSVKAAVMRALIESSRTNLLKNFRMRPCA
jgi:hypothetical protein